MRAKDENPRFHFNVKLQIRSNLEAVAFTVGLRLFISRATSL